jgi:hypothetical protein
MHLLHLLYIQTECYNTRNMVCLTVLFLYCTQHHGLFLTVWYVTVGVCNIPMSHGAATQRQITQRNCHKTSMLLNVYVPKRIITKRACHTKKAVIKRKTLQKVNITKRQMFQNITSQNENRHKTTKNV